MIIHPIPFIIGVMERFTAAFLIIGNEILSGRTKEKNLSVLADLLAAQGWRLGEVRVVADGEADIVAALNALRRRYAVVFTSGGIGPTHDDITTDAVAAAFNRPVSEHPKAVEIMENYYCSRELPFTAARRRMARTPQGAEVIVSEFPAAPAYRTDNVIVCAGVPSIFLQMAKAAVAALPFGVVRTSAALRVYMGESVFSGRLAEIAAAHPAVEIGSYPREENGAYVCQVVFTASDGEAREAARTVFRRYLEEAGLRYEEIGTENEKSPTR